VLALTVAPAVADELSVSSIVRTIRFHPEGEPARMGLRVLSRREAPGWRALASMLESFRESFPEFAQAAATSLVEGTEPERLEIAAKVYRRLRDDHLRAVLAIGLAYGYSGHESLLKRHMRKNRRGAVEVLGIVRGELDETELRDYLEIPDLAPQAYAELRRRRLTVRPKELVVWARAIALACLDRGRCEEWARSRDFTILEAVALVISGRDEEVRDGAHCLLLTLSGRSLAADTLIWRSWIEGNRKRAFDDPGPDTAGARAAAVVRGARYLRHDLMKDGRAVWSGDPNGTTTAIGATGLAVLALRAAGYPRNHPAIEKALKTLVLFGRGGAPALHEIRDRSRETYVLAILAMALCEIDPKRFKVPLQALAKRLVTGMQPHGQWSYQCLRPSDTLKPGIADNSITQYAVLALRSLRRKRFDVPRATWETILRHLQKSVSRHGGWNYRPTDRWEAGRQVSMTSAGLSSVAIALEALHGPKAAGVIRKDKVLRRARSYLGRLLMEGRFARLEPYVFYGVERACVLTATRGFFSRNRSFDWFAKGARELLGRQAADGHWGYNERRHIVGYSYGPAIDTAYAIFFLTRATTTVGGIAKNVEVQLKPEQDRPDPRPKKKQAPLPGPPRPPRLTLERETIPTRTNEAVLLGSTSGKTLTIDGKPVPLDARGRFSIRVGVAGPRTFGLVATDAAGLTTSRDARVVIDNVLPTLEMLGPPIRHLGKQVVVFRASEPLRSLQVGGNVFPADTRVVRAAVKIGAGRRELLVTATDLAGNMTSRRFVVEASQGALVLDGRSACWVDLTQQPRVFTIEAWVKGAPGTAASSVVANTEASGFSLTWWTKRYPLPNTGVRTGRRYSNVAARRQPPRGWVHLAMTYDRARVRFYMNGRLQGEAEGAPYVPSSRRLYIGAEPRRDNWPQAFFTGAIDEVRYSRVVRYTKDFRPRRTFMRDRHTVVLLHFDRDTSKTGGMFLDDSGKFHHAWLHGTPRVVGVAGEAGESDVLAHARGELGRLLPPRKPVPVLAAQVAAQNAAALLSARAMHLLDVVVRVESKNGVPYPGVAVRALQLPFDLSAGPLVTDERGEVKVRLPRGPWRIDLVTHQPKAGRVVFARILRDVRAAGREVMVLDARRRVRFRTKLGVARGAHVVTLAWPDLSLHKQIEVLQGQFEVVTTGDAPMVVQAVRRPAEQDPGYVIRRDVGPGLTIVDTEPEDATVHRFNGKGVRKLFVRYSGADALPVPLVFATDTIREVAFAGKQEVVLQVDVDWNGRRYGFYPRPYVLTGKPREFWCAPPFRASVGWANNENERYKAIRYSINIRVFLLTQNGLLVRHDPRGAYSVAWEQVLGDTVRKSGVTRPPNRILTPALEPKRIKELRYRLHIRGPGENRRVEVEGHPQVAEVKQGEVKTWCFPEVIPNTRMWARAVTRAIHAYEQTCPTNRPITEIHRSLQMPPGLAGMGGWRGAPGWMWLPEGSAYGFVGPIYWTGLLAHELGHVHGYMHGNPTERKIMRQAGRRAGRRLWSIRPGMARVPEGNRYRRLLDAVTGGALSVEQDFDDQLDIELMRKTGAGHGGNDDGVLAPNLEITGRDDVFLWFYRGVFGDKVDAERRKHAASWSWWLTRLGYTDDEIQIAMYSYSAKSSLAWLARLRGTMVHDRRITAATKELAGASAGKRFVWARERSGISNYWRHVLFAPHEDLDAQKRRMLGQLGHRWERVLALLRIARARFGRRESARGEALVLEALQEAQLGAAGMVERALAAAAPTWAAR